MPQSQEARVYCEGYVSRFGPVSASGSHQRFGARRRGNADGRCGQHQAGGRDSGVHGAGRGIHLRIPEFRIAIADHGDYADGVTTTKYDSSPLALTGGEVRTVVIVDSQLTSNPPGERGPCKRSAVGGYGPSCCLRVLRSPGSDCWLGTGAKVLSFSACNPLVRFSLGASLPLPIHFCCAILRSTLLCRADSCRCRLRPALPCGGDVPHCPHLSARPERVYAGAGVCGRQAV